MRILFFLFLINCILAQPSCIERKNYCSKCNPLTKLCAICDMKDILIPDNNGGCIGAKICKSGYNYCNECNGDGDMCQKCELGYFPDENGGCSNTLNCKLSYKGECLECEEDYILIGEKNFKKCKHILSDDFKNCAYINKERGRCEFCEIDYFLTKGDRKCTKTENCYEAVFGNCILCEHDFYLDKKEENCLNKTDSKFMLCQQTIDGENCDICDNGLYFDEVGNCSYSNYCSESLNGICRKCINGYFLSKNQFCTNTENCFQADKDTGICSSCDGEYYLDDEDYKCKSNLEDNDYKYCVTKKNDMCVKCVNGYYLGEDNKCTFTKNCKESENGKCIECFEHFYLGLDGYCTNIEHCIYADYNGECIECEDNYYYSNEYKECIRYEFGDKFYGCKYTYFNDACDECKNNFYNRYNDSLCIDNTKEGPFYRCAYDSEDGETCDWCIEDYYLGSEDLKCSLIENCKKSENENKCIECEDYFCLDVKNQKCIVNDYLEDVNIIRYFACIRTNEEGTSCEQCKEGYDINEEGYCVDNFNCEEKVNGKCIRCNNNSNKTNIYGYLIKYCANDIFGCVSTSYFHCLKCNNLENIHSCTECDEGYILNSYGNCIEEIQEE